MTDDKRNGYTMDDLTPIIQGKVELPNFQPQDLGQIVDNIAAVYGPGIKGNVRLPGAQHSEWAQVFLDYGQGGQLYGSGVVLYYGGYGKGGQAGKFAICEHVKKTDHDANPTRGWHPGRCVKCGLDMTIDSGD